MILVWAIIMGIIWTFSGAWWAATLCIIAFATWIIGPLLPKQNVNVVIKDENKRN